MAGVIDFGIRISQQIVGDDAIGKLAKLERQIASETQTIGRMEEKLVSAKRRLEDLMAGGASGKSSNLAAVQRAREGIAKLEGDLGKSRSKLSNLKLDLGDTKGLADTQEGLANVVAMAGPIGLLIGVVTALYAAVGALALRMTSFALESANAHRSMLLVMGALSGGADAGNANAAAIERVADSTALAKTQVESIGKRLATAGIDGQRFEATLGAISLASSLLGESAGAHIESIIERSKALGHLQISDRQLKGLGISFADLAAQVGMSAPAFKAAMKQGRVSVEQGVDAMNAALTKRFGAGGGALMLDFNVQLTKLHEHLAGLFQDVKLEPFLVSMKDLLGVFDKNTVTGAALHQMLTKGFDALFLAIAKVEPYAKTFFQGLVVGALLLYIAVLKVKQQIDKLGGGSSGIDGLTLALYAGIAVFGVLALAVAGTVAALALVALPFIVIGAVVYGAISAVISLWDTITAGVSQLPDLGAAAASMVDGLVNGVLQGGERFGAAMLALGERGMSALNSVFHFGSPSKAMEQRGVWIDEGGARGVERGGAMRRAMGGMAAPANAGGGDGAKGDGRTVNIYIDARGAKGDEIDDMVSKLADALEGFAITVGWGPAPEPAT